MEKSQDNFELDFKDGKVQIRRHSIGKDVIFQVAFSDGTRPLVLTRAKHSNAYKFWTSIPEGRQDEAEEVGLLISEYFKQFT